MKKYKFSWRGFYYDYWIDIITGIEFRFEMGKNPNELLK